jgi:flagellar basal body-associated protein FliL
MFAQSKGKAGLSFIAIIFVWIGITILVAGFIFIIGMAHSRASYYTQLARITLILYPIAGFIYFLLQKRFARNVV